MFHRLQHQKFNVRCSPKDVLDAIQCLKREQRDYVSDNGFGDLFDMSVEFFESRGLLDWLLENIDTSDMIIRASAGKNLEIAKNVIHQILGLPIAGGLPEKFEWAEAVAKTSTFRASIGLGPESFGVDKMMQ
ncbi:uncharacterized protein C2845_PM13G06740 [Panicum miliaceum]|uniref:Uncharacterized protein n=1 Tax=Panicum miliaceum TaxID=4540 RepID=A0A3L6RLJ1_PANMI|nr:uncharacterized protein C2845_PM13G06740 [Panicum miliaceum]